jgi:hypothetical protein|tara:strand:- start:258 stop:614 length:357 start_codon:yes stop_codon:yes gene_type:complete
MSKKKMSDIDTEKWMEKIRALAPVIEKAEYEIHLNEAEVKRMYAKLKIIAFAEGHKTVSSQECYADTDDELFTQRLRLGASKGALSALRVQLKALEIGFEQWRTEMVNSRKEYKRYGN